VHARRYEARQAPTFPAATAAAAACRRTTSRCAGIEAGGPERSVINTRVRQWRFTYPTAADRRAHDAVLAVKAHGVFLTMVDACKRFDRGVDG
jgi:hypothetical protein